MPAYLNDMIRFSTSSRRSVCYQRRKCFERRVFSHSSAIIWNSPP